MLWQLQALVGSGYDGDGFFEGDLAPGDLGVYEARHLSYLSLFPFLHSKIIFTLSLPEEMYDFPLPENEPDDSEEQARVF